MWFKNTLNNTLNRPTKLLRLDSTGETTKDRSDYTQEVRVIDPSKIGRNPEANSSYNFSFLEQFKSLGIISGSGSALMNSFNKFTRVDPELPMSDIDNIKMAGENMSGHNRSKINAWGSWPNNRRTPTQQNGFIKTGHFRKGDFRNKKSFKVPQDSPWLRVNSGYFHFQPSYSGSYDFNFRNSGKFCDINNSSNHKINSKHKNSQAQSPNFCYRGASVDPYPPKLHVSDKSLNAKLPVSDEHCTKISQSFKDSYGKIANDMLPIVCEDVSASHVIKRKCEDELHIEVNPLACANNTTEKTTESPKLENKDLCVVSKQDVVKEEDLKGLESESKRNEKISLSAPINRLDSCVEDLFRDVDTEHLKPKNDVNLENIQSQFNPNPQFVKTCDPSNAAKSAINSTTQPLQNSRTFHLTIIGGKCQAKEKTPPANSNSSQSNQHNNTSNCQSNQTLSSVESEKSAQENQDKNCSICTAYLNRVTPECKDFPKSAGCKHSIILLVRDQSKKTKKRKEKRPKKAQIQSPKSYIVGRVNSLDTTDNPGSHVFQIIPQNVSDSEESWDSFDDEEEEVDGASCDWSKIDMDDLFPTNNCLFNPMNFKVHISPVSCTESQIETSDSSTESSQTNKYLDSINLSWNIQVDEKPKCAKSKSLKKVRFAEDENLTKVYHMVAWSYAYRASRKGPWEQYARDRERFQRRILESDEVLSQILTDDHRSKIFDSLYGDGGN